MVHLTTLRNPLLRSPRSRLRKSCRRRSVRSPSRLERAVPTAIYPGLQKGPWRSSTALPRRCGRDISRDGLRIRARKGHRDGREEQEAGRLIAAPRPHAQHHHSPSIGATAWGNGASRLRSVLMRYDELGGRATFYPTGPEDSITSATAARSKPTPWRAVQGAVGIALGQAEEGNR